MAASSAHAAIDAVWRIESAKVIASLTRLVGDLGLAEEAAIAACHARAVTAEQTDWVRIAALYAALAQLAPSPVVELNRAVAVAMAFGPAEGLSLVDALTAEPSLAGYHLLPSVRGDLLAKLGRDEEASSARCAVAGLRPSGHHRTVWPLVRI